MCVALDLLDDVGIHGLSTRRLATALGIKSATLYWHFKRKDDILDEMSRAMFEECGRLENVSERDFDLLARMAENAREIRRVALSRRDGALIMGRIRTDGRVGSLDPDDVRGAMSCGLSEKEGALAVEILRRFAIGAATQEQSSHRNARAGSSSNADESFEFGLNTLIRGLRARIAERQPHAVRGMIA